MKASNYNYFLKYKDGNYYGYNFLYRSLIRLPESMYDEVSTLLTNPNNYLDCSNIQEDKSDWIKHLQKVKFIVSDDVSEIDVIKHFYYKNLYASDSLFMTILPTLACNLNCPYCFEYKKPIHMKADIEDAIMSWLEKYFNKKRFVHIAWFGGEPTLRKETIYNLSNRIKTFCNENKTEYKASMTTNGTLMDQEFLYKVNDLSITHIQVTFDGGKKFHDQSRCTPKGVGSFDKIIENLVLFCNTVDKDKCNLSIRVNCSDENYDSMEDLLDSIPSMVRSRATIFFRWIFDNEASAERGFENFSNTKQGGDYFLGLRALGDKARDKGFNVVDSFISKGFNFCEVDFRDQFTIYPDGKVFWCNLKDTEKDIIFNIKENILPDDTRSDTLSFYSKWMSTGPFSDDKCLSCNILPVCLGGCRKQRYEGNPNCMVGHSTLPFLVETLIAEKLTMRGEATRG